MVAAGGHLLPRPLTSSEAKLAVDALADVMWMCKSLKEIIFLMSDFILGTGLVPKLLGGPPITVVVVLLPPSPAMILIEI